MANRNRTVAHVAITCADDTVAIMEILSDDGRNIAQTVDAGSVNMLVARAAASFDKDKLPIKGWTPISRDDIPVDRTFRNALRHDGKTFYHDLEHAKRIGKDKIRLHRVKQLADLDVLVSRALVAGKGVEELEAQRQKLRDLPTIMDGCTTVDEVKAALPPGAE